MYCLRQLNADSHFSYHANMSNTNTLMTLERDATSYKIQGFADVQRSLPGVKATKCIITNSLVKSKLPKAFLQKIYRYSTRKLSGRRAPFTSSSCPDLCLLGGQTDSLVSAMATPRSGSGQSSGLWDDELTHMVSRLTNSGRPKINQRVSGRSDAKQVRQSSRSATI